MKKLLCLPVIAFLFFSGCSSGTTGVEVVNQNPTIRFTFVPLGVAKGGTVGLTVRVSDPNEDDVLTVTWDITRNKQTLTPGNTENTLMRWTAPIQVGVDTVIVRVSDGQASVTVVEEILVCTRTSSNNAQARYQKSQSPYIIAPTNSPPNLLVPSGGLSQVEAGVEILIDHPATVLNVFGTFQTNGTADDRVVIRPNDRTLFCGDKRGWWDGIRAESDEQSDGLVQLRYTDVSYGEKNVWLLGGASAVLNDSKFSCAKDAGILLGSSGGLTVDRCEVSNNKNHGIQVRRLTGDPPLAIAIRNSNITINGSAGIHLEINDVVLQVPVNITGNRIEFNLTNGIFITNASAPNITNNWIWSNNPLTNPNQNIWLDTTFPGGATLDTLDVTGNYWGAAWTWAQRGNIEQTIRDQADNPNIGTRLKIFRWLLAPPPL